MLGACRAGPDSPGGQEPRAAPRDGPCTGAAGAEEELAHGTDAGPSPPSRSSEEAGLVPDSQWGAGRPLSTRQQITPETETLQSCCAATLDWHFWAEMVSQSSPRTLHQERAGATGLVGVGCTPPSLKSRPVQSPCRGARSSCSLSSSEGLARRGSGPGEGPGRLPGQCSRGAAAHLLSRPPPTAPCAR